MQWYQKDVVCYALLKPNETINTERYGQQIVNMNQELQEKRPEF